MKTKLEEIIRISNKLIDGGFIDQADRDVAARLDIDLYNLKQLIVDIYATLEEDEYS